MGRFDILTMDDDEREALAERPVHPEQTNRRGQILSNPSLVVGPAQPTGDLEPDPTAGWGERGLDYADDDPQEPSRYVFAIVDDDDGDVTVAITPLSYWEVERAQSDWELPIEHLLPPYLRDQVMESTFHVSGASAEQIIQDMIALGFNHDPEFQQLFTGGD